MRWEAGDHTAAIFFLRKKIHIFKTLQAQHQEYITMRQQNFTETGEVKLRNIQTCCLYNYSVILLWLATGWLFGFYGISTIVGYLMPNPVYTYIYIYNIYDL